VAEATLLAIEELNAKGGVLGRPVHPVVVDGRSNASTFVKEAEKLVSDGQVCTVFGCWTSASRKAVVPIFEKYDHLLVYPVQYEGIEESPNIIYTGAAPNQQIIPAVRWASSSLNKRRWFLVGSDYVFPRIASEIIKDQAKELSAEVVGEEYMLLGSRDATAIVEQIVLAKPDVILNTINGDSNVAFFGALRAAGVTPESIPTISFSIGETEIQHLDASAMGGDFAAWNYFQSIDSPENEYFVGSFKARYGPQRLVTDPMEAAYFGVLLWGKAVEDAASIEPAQIRRAMRNQRMRAPSGDIRIDPTTQHTFKTPRIGRIRADGQFDIVWEAAEPAQPVPYPTTRTTEQWRAVLHDLYTGWNNHWAAPQ
jgi:urea transport system substrate-binding protein